MINFLGRVALFLVVGPIVIRGAVDVVKTAATVFDSKKKPT